MGIATHRVHTDVPDKVAFPGASISATGPVAGVRFRGPMSSPVLIEVATVDGAVVAAWHVAH